MISVLVTRGAFESAAARLVRTIGVLELAAMEPIEALGTALASAQTYGEATLVARPGIGAIVILGALKAAVSVAPDTRRETAGVPTTLGELEAAVSGGDGADRGPGHRTDISTKRVSGAIDTEA